MPAIPGMAANFADAARQWPPHYTVIVTMGGEATADTWVVTIDHTEKTVTIAFTDAA